MSKEVANTKEALPVVSTVFDQLIEEEDLGLDFKIDELKIPYIGQVQMASKCLIKKNERYIEGIELGDIYNNITGQFWKGDEGIKFVVCARERVYLVKNTSPEGGTLEQLPETDERVRKLKSMGPRGGNQMPLTEETELCKTDRFYVLILDESGARIPGLLECSKSKLAASEQTMSIMANLAKHKREWTDEEISFAKKHGKKIDKGQKLTPAMWTSVWHYTSVEAVNKDGRPYQNYKVKFDSHIHITEENTGLLNEIKEFASSVVSGDVSLAEDNPTEDSLREEPEQHSAF
tara:strand:- start:1001 stop:1873 length:873 start_codon:yes stop_codon:yes gene_type:complete